jgi:hypothetical protein
LKNQSETMSYRVITPEIETKRVRASAIEARANGECGIYYQERVDKYMMFNFKEIVAEFSRFPIDKRPRGYEGGDEIKKKCIQAIEHNNQTRIIDGKPVYTLVLQQADSSICPLGWGFDDAGLLVSGWIYCFFNEKIRDGLFNRFFVLPNPPAPAPAPPVIPVETRALEYFTQHYLDNTAQTVYDLISDNIDNPTEEIGETVMGIVRRNVTSTVLKTCKHKELNENILEALYGLFMDKVMETVEVLRENYMKEREEIMEEFRENNKPKQKTKKVGVCITCKSVARLRCGGCKRACYCSAECQRSDWLHHKEICEGCN